MICFQILSLYSITTGYIDQKAGNWLWFAFRFYLCIQSQQNVSRSNENNSCDLLSDFIFVFNHNSAELLNINTTVVICFQILSLYSITTAHGLILNPHKLWFAFRFYLCIQSQQIRPSITPFAGCDLLSDFIFVFNHNTQHHESNYQNVVICFQILSLYSITTLNQVLDFAFVLWFAFRFYLCIQSQLHRGGYVYVSCCDLLSDFIFVFNHNRLSHKTKVIRPIGLFLQIKKQAFSG